MKNIIKSKLIFLPMEIKTREFYPKLFFAKKALDRGYCCFIGDKAGIFRATKYFNNGIYFYKSINSTDTKHIFKIKNKNNSFISLDEEGGFAISSSEEFKNFLSHRSSLKNMQLVDKIFTYGNFDNEIWKKKYIKYRRKIKISGGIRFDLCKKNILKKVYRNEIKNIEKKYGQNYILIATSFISSKKEISNYLNSDKFFLKKMPKSYIKKRYNHLINQYKLGVKFKSLIQKIILSFPEKKIILRPHPSENLIDWKKYKSKILKDNDNFVIDTYHDLNSLIYNSNYLIHCESTAALQSLIQKKKTISYKPKGVKLRRKLFNSIGNVANSEKQVIDIIKTSKKNLLKPTNLNLIKQHVNNLSSKKLASDIILSELSNLKEKTSKINLTKLIFLSPIYSISDFFFNLFKLRQYNSSHYAYAIRSNLQKFGKVGIKKKELINFFLNFNTKKHKYSIYSFGKNCFFLKKN